MSDFTPDEIALLVLAGVSVNRDVGDQVDRLSNNTAVPPEIEELQDVLLSAMTHHGLTDSFEPNELGKVLDRLIGKLAQKLVDLPDDVET